jgi:hypothetical protein
MKTPALRSLLATVAIAALTACGGGEDSTSGSAEGIWGGTTSTGEETVLIVLADGETWGIYGDEADATAGILQGNLASSDGLVSGTLLDFNLTGLGQTNLGIRGTVNSRNAMNLVIASSATLNMGYDRTYDTPASLSTMTGSYRGLALGPGRVDETARVVISGTTITTSSATYPDCVGAGTVSLRSGNKAVVDFSIRFEGEGCLVPNNTMISGVAQYSNGSITAVGLNSGRTQGVLLVADRSAS